MRLSGLCGENPSRVQIIEKRENKAFVYKQEKSYGKKVVSGSSEYDSLCYHNPNEDYNVFMS